MLSSNVLVLNRSFMPVHITTVRHALCLLFKGVAKAVHDQYVLYDFESWQQLSARTHSEHVGLVSRSIRVPRVILLCVYDHVPNRQVRFSRINIYLRDQHTCQYCGQRFIKSELNLDHVVPVSLGGKTTWENVVCSCIKCNIKKGGRLPMQAGMKLLKKPMVPHWSWLFRLLSKPVCYAEWKPFLNMVDFSYWNVELKD